MTGGQCWTKDGKPKKRYDTRAAAKRARQRALAKYDNDPGQPYRCPTCEYFHLGHYPTSQEVRRRFRRRHRGEVA